MFICSKIAQLFSFSICFTLSICDEDYTTGGTCGTGTTYPSRASKCTPGFKWGLCCSSVLCVVLSGLLLVVLSSFFWSLCCLSVCLILTDIDYLFGVFKLFLHVKFVDGISFVLLIFHMGLDIVVKRI